MTPFLLVWEIMTCRLLMPNAGKITEINGLDVIKFESDKVWAGCLLKINAIFPWFLCICEHL